MTSHTATLFYFAAPFFYAILVLARYESKTALLVAGTCCHQFSPVSWLRGRLQKQAKSHQSALHLDGAGLSSCTWFCVLLQASQSPMPCNASTQSWLNRSADATTTLVHQAALLSSNERQRLRLPAGQWADSRQSLTKKTQNPAMHCQGIRT